MTTHDITLTLKGGPGSGHKGHKGRPGKKGGSLPGKGISIDDAVEQLYARWPGILKDVGGSAGVRNALEALEEHGISIDMSNSSADQVHDIKRFIRGVYTQDEFLVRFGWKVPEPEPKPEPEQLANREYTLGEMEPCRLHIGTSADSFHHHKRITDLDGTNMHPSALEDEDAHNFCADGIDTISSPMSQSQRWGLATSEQRSETKSEIVQNISEASGVVDYGVNQIIGSWAESANDNDMRSLSLQEAASEEFDVSMSKWQQQNIAAVRTRLDAAVQSWEISYGMEDALKKTEGLHPEYHPITTRENERAVLRAMYNNTQKRFSDLGYAPTDTIRLFRGIHNQDIYRDGETVRISGNTMESWSAGYTTASMFAGNMHSMGVNGIVLVSEVPVNRIVGSCRTGFGCLTEGEFVVLGGEYDATVINYE